MRSETICRSGWSGIAASDGLEETTMSQDELRNASRRGRRHGHARRSGGGRGGARVAAPPPEHAETAMLGDLDPSLLDEEERALAEAHAAAEAKVELYRDAAKLAIIVVPLMIFVPFLGFIALFFGGMKVARKAYRLLYEPTLRDRLIGDEVRKRVKSSVHEERRQMEDEHSRSLEHLSASIAHEIRNPITAAKSLVQQMGEEPDGPDNVEYARVALQELERVERSISHLLRYAREEDMRLASVRMADVVDSALETFRDRAKREHVEIVRQVDSEGLLRGDAEQLRRVVINLVGNAIDAVVDARREKPRIVVAMGENLAGTEVWLRVADNGLGMDDETRARVFDPFVTSKEDGTGLGLPIVKRIIETHGGKIELSSTTGEGTEFILSFPKNAAHGGGLA